MTGGVGVHQAVVGVGLVLVFGGTGRQYARFGRRQVVNVEVEVHLHRRGRVGPGRRGVAGSGLEVDAAVRTVDGGPEFVGVRHRTAGDLGVERRQLPRQTAVKAILFWRWITSPPV